MPSINPIPWPRLHRDAMGVRVRTLVTLSNFAVKIPAGTLGRITATGRGWDWLSFQGDPCACCGVQPRISRCSKSAFEPVEETA